MSWNKFYIIYAWVINTTLILCAIASFIEAIVGIDPVKNAFFFIQTIIIIIIFSLFNKKKVSEWCSNLLK